MAITNYYSVNGRILGQKTAGKEQIDYMPESLGSVKATVNQTTGVQNAYSYRPYGAVGARGTQSQPDPKFLHVGRQGYRQTGRPYSDQYIRARHRDTNTGMWTTIDPLWPREYAYIYVENNPITSLDPTGEVVVKNIACKGCGKTLFVTPDKGDTTAVIAGRPQPGTRFTKVVSGRECLKLAKELFPNKNCVCVNGGFFYRGNPQGKLDPCNSDPVGGVGSPSERRGKKIPGRSDIIVNTDNGYLTGVQGTPPSPGSSNSPGRSGACLNKQNKVIGLIVARGCAAKTFKKCAEKACPKGSKFAWLDGGGSSQVWQNGKSLVLGNSSSTGKPDGRSVDNWIVVCE